MTCPPFRGGDETKPLSPRSFSLAHQHPPSKNPINSKPTFYSTLYSHSNMPAFAINVSGISPDSTQSKLDQFFSFCGKISSITLTPGAESQSAVIVFEKESAAKTALLLNEGTLDGAHLHVTSESLSTASSTSGEEPSISQEDKPKAAIIAEYLASGYVLSDQAIQRAIDEDAKLGISSRFLAFIHSLDKKAGEALAGPEHTISGKAHEVLDPLVATAVSKTKEVDQSAGISTRAGDIYSKGLATDIGKKIFSFYTQTKKEVEDVHREAKRIADASAASTATPAAPTGAAAPVAPAPALV
ncbi:hypothetical protein BDY24DRAFT_376433 [Mrakia frigida]|uniref:uncharacterized protein n=1 Tax=Mrakia frigida TaxID=29902 RepID=UPI003FCBF791